MAKWTKEKSAMVENIVMRTALKFNVETIESTKEKNVMVAMIA